MRARYFLTHVKLVGHSAAGQLFRVTFNGPKHGFEHWIVESRRLGNAMLRRTNSCSRSQDFWMRTQCSIQKAVEVSGGDLRFWRFDRGDHIRELSVVGWIG